MSIGPFSLRWWASLPGGCPVTWGLIAANAVTFLGSFLGFPLPLAFFSPAFPARPWTALTYALDGSGSVLSLLLSSYALWLFGGSLERAWLVRDYLQFLLFTTPTPALVLWVVQFLDGRGLELSGPWLVVAACAVAWSVIHPRERLWVYFAIPVEGRWMGWLAAALVFFSFPFPLGLFSLAGCGVAWWYASGGRYRSRGSLGARLPDLWGAYRRWRRKREFRRLMRRSGLDDLH